jgi:hypothetical protein
VSSRGCQDKQSVALDFLRTLFYQECDKNCTANLYVMFAES